MSSPLQCPSPVAIVRKIRRFSATSQLGWIVLALASVLHASAAPPATANDACFRPAQGSAASNPPELRSRNGVLELTIKFQYRHTMMGEGPVRYCYVTGAGEMAPTLRVHPGDRLVIHFLNEAPASKYVSAPSVATHDKPDCADSSMGFFSTNLHFHGMSIPPLCHQDDVLHTFVQPGQKFDYEVRIPAGQPPGLYWYHPHVHGITESQLQGGASGALIVEGIEKQHPFLSHLPQRVLMVRDQQATPSLDHAAPTWDLSLNYVPILYPALLPATLSTEAHQKEFWRVVNAAADTLLDLQLLSNGHAQPLQLIALDGVSVDHAASSVQDIPLPPGSRAEFVVQTPDAGQRMELITREWDTGPAGDSDPRRPLAQVIAKPGTAAASALAGAARSTAPATPPWKGTTLDRRLYFSEASPNPNDPDISTFFFITADGQKPALFEMGSPPNIVLHQGAVEVWTIENRAAEDHVFHIHQLHFRVLAIDGTPVHDAELRDTINVPYWKGEGPYPSVKLLMDFRDPAIVGTFPYHCHIEKHADMGMMGTVEVLTPGRKTFVTMEPAPVHPAMGNEMKFTVKVAPDTRGGPPLTGKVQLNIDGQNRDEMVSLSNGQAVLPASFPERGEHMVKVMYWGNPDYAESAAQTTVKVR